MGGKGANSKSQRRKGAAAAGDWLDELRNSLGKIDRPLVVVSLFDGIGGTWAALNRLGVPFIGYSCEIDAQAVQVLDAKYPNVKQLGDVRAFRRELVREKNVDLVVGGFPCQDLSSMGKKLGLHGPRSRLFFDMLRVLHILKPKWFLAENVSSMKWIDQEEITKYLKCRPIDVDSQCLTASRRRRLYWTNIPHPQTLPDVKVVLQDHLDNAQALEEKVGVIMSCNYTVGSKVQLQRVYSLEKRKLRYVTPEEVEKTMGFPVGHTDIAFNRGDDDKSTRYLSTTDKKKQYKNIRWSLLGNSFSVPVISYLLSPLLDRSVRENWKEHQFSENFDEKQCSVMQKGEVWALYGEQRQPNWYAVIDTMAGDRFSESLENKKPLKIEARFLHLHPKYKADQWNPSRGTGYYEISEECDIQVSWVAFSQRIDFSVIDGYYFIHPRGGEIWAVIDPRSSQPTPIFVYVKASEMTHNQPLQPGKENFHASCTLLQKVDKEFFRCTEVNLECTDLGQFYYSVPYYYKSSANTFKLELNQRSWSHMDDGTSRLGRGRKRRKGSDDDGDDENDDENDDTNEEDEDEKKPKKRGDERLDPQVQAATRDARRMRRHTVRESKVAKPKPVQAQTSDPDIIDLDSD